MKFGAHMSTAGGVSKALERGASIHCEVVQIFLKNNMRWFGSPYQPQDVAEFHKLRTAHNFAAVFGHCGYLINLGAPPSENRDNSILSLLQELQFAAQLDLPFVVLHPGSHLEAGEEQGVNQVIAGLDQVFEATRESKVRIALENTAGQGSCLGNRFEHMAEIFQKVKRPERLGLCIDTAHLLASGFDIRSPNGWDSTVQTIDLLIGLNQILAFHLNDSKPELGSGVDRHEHIGKGKIGMEAFRYLLNDTRFTDTPGCLETPKSKDLHEDVENLAILRQLTTRGVKK